jgi:uncharacterized repeat protein (TIGR01451 family)
MKNKLNDGLLNYKLVFSGLFLVLAMQSSFVYAEKAAVVPAQAKKTEPLTITLTAQKVLKDAKGKEVFSGAEKVKPGDVVEYRASYANISKAALSGVIANLPVPEGMVYVDKTANPAAATATVDGVKYDAVPLKRKVKDKAGKEVVQLVPLSEYKGLNWSLGNIQAGKTRVVSARVRVAK